MRRLFSLLLVLLFLSCTIDVALGDAVPNGMRILSCPEGHFSTLVDFDCETEFREGDGLYIYTYKQGWFPYILVHVGWLDGRILDGETYIREKLIPDYQDSYGANGPLVITQHGDFTIGGHSAAAVDVQYHRASDGMKIYFLTVIDVQEDFTASYRIRYTEESERKDLLADLDTIAANMHADADYYTGSYTQAPQNQSGEAAAHCFTVTSIKQDNMIVGRCTAPADYTITSQAFCCTLAQSAGNPWLLMVAASSETGILMSYASGRDYYANANGVTQDEVFSSEFFTPMLHYMNAADYCDYWASRMNPTAKTIKLVEENTYPGQQAMLRDAEKSYMDMVNTEANSLGLTMDKAAFTLGMRRYYLETDSGLEYYFCVATATRGAWYTASLPGLYINISNSYILWDSPYVYTMLCPVRLWEEESDVFTTFMENTSVSDQFLLANQRLSAELWSILTGVNLNSGATYSRDVMREETGKGEDYDDERYTDYIFDQNDYTLSDGSHVKVSTAYDYVYEGDNGVVYYSDSALAQPGGSNQLTPNR